MTGYIENGTQEERILALLKQRGNAGVMVYELMAPRPEGLGIAQYGARILGLRRKGFNIINTQPGHFVLEEKPYVPIIPRTEAKPMQAMLFSLLLTIFSTYVFLFPQSVMALSKQEIRANLENRAKVIQERNEKIAYERQLNLRAQREAERLGVAFDPKRVNVVRSIISVFGPDYKMALAVAKPEGGFRCDAKNVNTNGTVDVGPFQLNSVHKWRGNLTDCQENIRIAYEIYQQQGWRPWVVFQKGIYKNYL